MILNSVLDCGITITRITTTIKARSRYKFSVQGPETLLRLNLTLQSASQPDNEKLAESNADSDASHSVQVVVDQSL